MPQQVTLSHVDFGLVALCIVVIHNISTVAISGQCWYKYSFLSACCTSTYVLYLQVFICFWQI